MPPRGRRERDLDLGGSQLVGDFQLEAVRPLVVDLVVDTMMKPAGPAIPGGGSSGPSADAQAFWEGEDVPLVALQY
jgi:hypothetical protein